MIGELVSMTKILEKAMVSCSRQVLRAYLRSECSKLKGLNIVNFLITSKEIKSIIKIILFLNMECEFVKMFLFLYILKDKRFHQ